MSQTFVSSRLSRGLASLAAVGLLASCGRTASEPVSLAGLSDRTLTFALADVDDAETPDALGAHRFTVAFSLAEGDACTKLAEGVTATFNGQPMHLEGGGAPDVDGRGDACEATRAWFDFDPAAWTTEPTEDARILLQDDTATLSLIIEDAKVKRLFAFQGPGTVDRLRRGQTYSFVWQPESEVPGPITATLLREGGSAAATLAVTQEGGKVSFTLPAGTPLANHVLTLSATVPGKVLDCQGVTSCSGAVFHSQDFSVSVVP
ncbi:hypothetical protein JGU66_11185 [Myxococcaceae bacterium JPH2]|nr:hypothetical protein [Myxococcaceae bacterium JPH2]